MEVPYKAPYIGLIYGGYLQFRFLKWPLIDWICQKSAWFLVLQVSLCSSLPQIQRMPQGSPLPSLRVGTRAQRGWIKASWIPAELVDFSDWWGWCGPFLGQWTPPCQLAWSFLSISTAPHSARALGVWGWWRAQSIETCFYTEDSTGTSFQPSTFDILLLYHAISCQYRRALQFFCSSRCTLKFGVWAHGTGSLHEPGMGQTRSTQHQLRPAKKLGQWIVSKWMSVAL